MRSWLAAITSFVTVTADLVRHTPRADVVFLNASAPGVFVLGPVVWLITRLHRKPLVVRFFGANLLDSYGTVPAPVRRAVASTLFRADRLLLQTRGLEAAFQERFPEARTAWYPTTRNVQMTETG